jgi:hypothetical protein
LYWVQAIAGVALGIHAIILYSTGHWVIGLAVTLLGTARTSLAIAITASGG